MKILFITQWFQPEPFVNGLPFAKQLVSRGHDVQVLTGFPNYPGGKVYNGYKIKMLQKEVVDGVSIIRVPLYPSHDRSAVRRILNYTSLALSAATIGTWVIKPVDAVYVCHPPATMYLPASVIRMIRRVPFLYNIQDLWPDALASSGMVRNKAALWLADRFCRYFYRSADRVIAQSPGIKKELCSRGIPSDKIEVIYNWCDDTQIKMVDKDPVLARELGFENRFNILFAGGIGTGQALGAVLDAASILQNKCSEIQFVFIGTGIELDRLKQKKENLGLNNVRFLARRPPSEISAVLSLADILLVHLKDNLLHEITIPSKTQAYMAAGKPILIGVKGDAADLVMQAKAGLKCEPENPQSIAEAALMLKNMSASELAAMGENGRRFYNEHLSLEIGTRHYEKAFETIINEYCARHKKHQ